MITEATPTEHSVAEQLHAVAQAAYALEATWIGCADFPPLRESLDRLRLCSDSFIVFEDAGRIVGALSFDRTADPVLITRLVVSPRHLRQGIATALLTELERRLPATARLSVITAQANTAAVSLYRRLGYTEAEVTNSAEGIPLLRLTKSK
jgi:ribosomal protein S18 acetylase RimI-like enzyme